MAEPAEIYGWIAQQGPPSTLPGPWSSRPCHEAFIDLPGPTQLKRGLNKAFSAEDLQTAGAYVVNERGKPELSPRFTNQTSFVLPLRTADGEPPFDVLIGDQCLSGKRSGWSAVRADHHLQSRLSDDAPALYGVFGAADLAVFWSLGLQAIPAQDLCRLSGKSIDRFAAMLGLTRSKYAASWKGPSDTPAEDVQPFTLVAWSLATLDLAQPVALQAVVDHLRKLAEFLGLQVDEIGIWKPLPAELKQIEFALRYGTSERVTRSLHDLADQYAPLVDPAPIRKEGPQSYAEAMREWFSTNRAAPDPGRRRETWAQLQALQQAELIDPLLRAAKEARDPVAANQLQLAAHLCSLLYPKTLTLAANFRDRVLGQGVQGAPGYRPEDLEQALALTDRVRGLLSEVRPWNRRRNLPSRSSPGKNQMKRSGKGSVSLHRRLRR